MGEVSRESFQLQNRKRKRAQFFRGALGTSGPSPGGDPHPNHARGNRCLLTHRAELQRRGRLTPRVGTHRAGTLRWSPQGPGFRRTRRSAPLPFFHTHLAPKTCPAARRGFGGARAALLRPALAAQVTTGLRLARCRRARVEGASDRNRVNPVRQAGCFSLHMSRSPPFPTRSP